MKANKSLLIGGVLSMMASLLHITIIMGGADWYRYFGAGEGMAQLDEAGSTYPMIVTSIIAMVLAVWGLYAFSGAGIIRQLPLLKPALVAISVVYIARGILFIPIIITVDHPYLNELEDKMAFAIVSSFVALCFGLFYAIGLKQIWLKNVLGTPKA